MDDRHQNANHGYDQKPAEERVKRDRRLKGTAAGLAVLAVILTAVSVLQIAGGSRNASGEREEPIYTPEADSESAVTPDSESAETGKNSGFYSMMGTVMHLNDHTYFIQSGVDNDCSENGSEYSEGIWRIGDEADAEPELVYSVPSNMIDGLAQNTIVDLAGADDKIWYMQAENGSSTDYSMHWVTADGEETGTVELPEHDWINKVDFDDNCYYIEYTVEKEEENPVTDVWVYNIETEAEEDLSITYPENAETLELLTVSYDYIYFLISEDKPVLCRE